MQRSTTISQELIGLFDTVRNQADEYVVSFNIIRRKSREMDALRNDMQQALATFKKEGANEMNQLKQSVGCAVVNLNDKIEFVGEVYKDIETIHQLTDTLQELRVSLDKRHIELDVLISTIRGKVKTETEKEFIRHERKLSTQLKRMEEEQSVLAARVLTTQDTQNRELNHIGEEINRFKNKITETKFIVDETTKIVNQTIERAERKFDGQMQKYDVEIDAKITDAVENLLKGSNYQRRGDRMATQLALLSQKFSDLQISSQTKVMIAIVFGIVSLLLSVFALLRH